MAQSKSKKKDKKKAKQKPLVQPSGKSKKK